MKMIIAQRSAGCTKSMMIIMMQKLWVKRILRNDTKSHHSTVPPIPVQTPNLYLRIYQLDDEEAESVTAVKGCFFSGEKHLSQKVNLYSGLKEKERNFVKERSVFCRLILIKLGHPSQPSQARIYV